MLLDGGLRCLRVCAVGRVRRLYEAEALANDPLLDGAHADPIGRSALRGWCCLCWLSSGFSAGLWAVFF